MNLSKRLAVLLSLIPEGGFLSDVGSDHAYLPAAAILDGKVEAAQAIDNKEGPFAHMAKTVKDLGLEGRLFLSLSSGLDDLDPRATTLVLAGMGGDLISSILLQGKAKLGAVEHLVVDAHSERSLLQETLLGLGYAPEAGRFIADRGKFYSLERWSKGAFEKELAPIEERYGILPSRGREEAFLSYLRAEEARMKAQLAHPSLPEGKKKEAEETIRLIEEYLHENA